MPQYKQPTANGVRWFCKFNYRDPETGMVKTKLKRGFVTRRDAKLFEEKFLAELAVDDTAGSADIKPTFEDVHDEYLQSHKRADIKESSLQTKRSIMEKHIFPTFRDTPVEDITEDSIARWQNDMRAKVLPNGKHFSNSFLRTVQSQLNAVINYAYAKGYLKANPLVDIKNMGQKEKRTAVWTPEEYEKFAYNAMNYPEYYYLYEVLYFTGLREGEALALTWRDIDLTGKSISVSKTYQVINGKELITTPKTESSNRKVTIPDFLADELREYHQMLFEPELDDRIFASVTKSGLSKNFKMLSEKAGVPCLTVHGLRHSHVSYLISRHYDIFQISKHIGHSSVSITQDTYGHLFDSVQKDMAEDLNKMRSGGRNV